MNKNQLFTAEITGITSQGLGVARFEERAVFVKGAIPGKPAISALSRWGKRQFTGGWRRFSRHRPIA